MADKVRIQTVFGESPVPEPSPGRPRKKPVDTETAGIIRGMILVTGVFLTLALFIVLLKYFPGTPDLPAIPDTGEYARLFASDEAKLNNYSWVNQKSGIVRIPIKEAMTIIAERGLPSRDIVEPASSEDEAVEGSSTEEGATEESESASDESSQSEAETTEPETEGENP